MKTGLNLGCGGRISDEEGVINVDIREWPSWKDAKKLGAKFAIADLNDDWPWKDNSFDVINAKDIYEHLPDIIHTMAESYRVLKPGGIIHLWVPTTDSLAAFADPTHKSFWNLNTFYYFTYTKHSDWKEPIYSDLIKERFILEKAKVFIYRDLPNSRGVYVRLRKPEPGATMDEEEE